MTRALLESRVRALWEEAFAFDPHQTCALVDAVLGVEVWAWSALPTRKLRELLVALIPTMVRSRTRRSAFVERAEQKKRTAK